MFDESVLTQEKAMSPAGASARRWPAPGGPSALHGQLQQKLFLKSPSIVQKVNASYLHKIYLNYKSYLKRKTMSKLHKTFESFLTA
ncbi:MAG: hypothetical protein ACLTNY_03580 [Blautia massiliensis (ex Durand et al. 2017)]